MASQARGLCRTAGNPPRLLAWTCEVLKPTWPKQVAGRSCDDELQALRIAIADRTPILPRQSSLRLLRFEFVRPRVVRFVKSGWTHRTTRQPADLGSLCWPRTSWTRQSPATALSP